MSTSYVVAVFKLTNMDATSLKRRVFPETGIGSAAANRAVNNIAKLAQAVAVGARAGSLVAATVIDDAGTKPAGSIVCTRANAATDTVTFTYAGQTVVFTEATDYVRGASDTTCGANLAEAINANAILKTILTAVSVTGTITITTKVPTALAEDIIMSTSDGTAFALTQITGGTAGAAQFFLQGFQTAGTL